VRNKLHWAITGKTAAEIIYASADSGKSDFNREIKRIHGKHKQESNDE